MTVNGALVWNGKTALEKVINTVRKNNAVHLTRYAFCRKGGFFDQQPVHAGKDLIPRKKGLEPNKYGGYTGRTAAYFTIAQYLIGKKRETTFLPVELYQKNRFEKSYDSACEYVKEKIGAEITDICLPLYPRVIKVNTILEVDGMRMYITAGSLKDGRMNFSLIEPLILGYKWEKYIKRMERFAERKKENSNIIYSYEYDKISAEENIALYDQLLSKLKTPKYAGRPANPENVLRKGREIFETLDIDKQVRCIMQILMVFGRISPCNLSDVGGPANAAKCRENLNLKNWRKKYTDVRIVDQSAAGLFETRSVNLLELL